MIMFDHFDSIRIINLPHRRDRRREMAEQLRRVGLEGNPKVSFYAAARPAEAGLFSSLGAYGCFLSHLGILKDAAGGSVLILEDDCDFTPSASKTVLPDDVDIFYGGVLSASNPESLHDSDIIGSHCMGFSARAAALAADYLATFLAPQFRPDQKAAQNPSYNPAIRPPVDGAYVWFRRAHPELKTMFAQPPIACQRPSRTDIGELRFYDRLPLLRAASSIARRILGGWRGGSVS